MTTFRELGLSPEMLRAVSAAGFEEPTPIQARVIPLALTGRDVVGQAQTGTGKTAAFGIPVLERLDPAGPSPQVLILTPTRELAIQVAEELARLAPRGRHLVLPIYGGQDFGHQLRALRANPKVLVCTPGRLLDHMRRKTVHLDGVRVVVLDEADEMLNMGFIDDVEAILSAVPEDRQTMLFSATMPSAVASLAQRFLRDPVRVAVAPKQVTVPQVRQAYIEVREDQKFETLCRVLDVDSPALAIVFGRTKRRVGEIAEGLQKRGYLAEALHGDLSQRQRDQVMRRFRSGACEVLVATDVAARGLDVSDVTHVINFDIPQDPESYVHRVGRTGRAGRAGEAVTFVTPRELRQLHWIEQATRQTLARRHAPTLADALEGQRSAVAGRLIETMEQGAVDAYLGLAETLLETYDSTRLVAAALAALTPTRREVEVRLTPEEPPRRAPRRTGRRGFGAAANGRERRRAREEETAGGRR
ncbi:MAG: DEAD/DEAH box helicase [Clostridia bacterium]|nr:DEAD/DEAH box helicase [Clostridia bacterium]